MRNDLQSAINFIWYCLELVFETFSTSNLWISSSWECETHSHVISFIFYATSKTFAPPHNKFNFKYSLLEIRHHITHAFKYNFHIFSSITLSQPKIRVCVKNGVRMKNMSSTPEYLHTKADYVDSNVRSSHEYVKDNCLYECLCEKWKTKKKWIK